MDEDKEMKALQETLEKPLTQDEANQMFADLDVEKLRLNVIRQKWLTQIEQLKMQVSDLDTKLVALELNKAVVFRRTLNGPQS